MRGRGREWQQGIRIKGVFMELIVKNLNKKYGSKEVLADVSYRFEDRKIYGILGRNGAGKTTLFNCLSNQTIYDSGEVVLSESGVERPLTFSDIALVSASPQLPDYLTGYEFVHFFSEMNGGKKTTSEIDDLFSLIQIEPSDRHRLIREYSYGMKNKLQLLCCLVRSPKVILLDEPLSSFDIIVSHEIKDLLLRMRSDHIILMCTHIMQLAQDICDVIILLHEKKLRDVEFTDYHSADFEQMVIKALENHELH